jgi:hypothetical protein
MKVISRTLLSLGVAASMGACTVSPPPPTVDEVVDEMEVTLNSQDGQTSVEAFSVSYPGLSIEMTFDAYAYCMPSDPLAAPVIPAVAPNNILGCRNALGLEYSGSSTGDEIQVTMTIADLVVHFSGKVSGISFRGYVSDSDLVITITQKIIANRNGTYSLDGSVPPLVELELNNPVLDTNNAVLDGIGEAILDLLESQVEAEAGEIIASVVQDYASTQAPDFVF